MCLFWNSNGEVILTFKDQCKTFVENAEAVLVYPKYKIPKNRDLGLLLLHNTTNSHYIVIINWKGTIYLKNWHDLNHAMLIKFSIILIIKWNARILGLSNLKVNLTARNIFLTILS